MITSSFYVPTEKLSVVQTLVKQHNLHFCRNPIIGRNRTHITLSGDVFDFNAFNVNYVRVITNITEKKSNVLKRVFRMIKGRIIGFIKD
jgi:hypothetical protein